MGRSNKQDKLTHSDYTIENGHGGMKRNRLSSFLPRLTPRRMPEGGWQGNDPLSIVGRAAMGEGGTAVHVNRGMRNIHDPMLRIRSRDKINDQVRDSLPPPPETMPTGGIPRGGRPSSPGGAGAGRGGYRTITPTGLGQRKRRGIVTVGPIPTDEED